LINNKAITKIQLPNIENDPVTLNFEFTGCSNLERIYGNLKITKTAAFRGCAKFTVHGGRFLQNGVSTATVTNDVYHRILYLADEPTQNRSLRDEFQQGKEVTNLIIDVENASSMFSGTNVDCFDVYYVLRHLSSNVRSISSMFSGCTLDFDSRGYVHNDPH
jgi:hypothetical protein